MMRGEIYWAELQGNGHKQRGLRPVLVVQSNGLNMSTFKSVMVCPITTAIRSIVTHPVLEPTPANGLKKLSAVMCDHVVTIDKVDLQDRMGIVSQVDMIRVGMSLLKSLAIFHV
jgi:mRNA interferase MazF